MAAPEPFPGSICDVAGLSVGHFTDTRRPTGCSVVLCEQGVVAGVDVRGAAPGTRETDLLDPRNSVEEVHAVLLTGGSAFGLDAASGVMRWLEERGHGIVVGPARVPIVPAAVLFDLWLGDQRIRPDAAAGYAACTAATTRAPEQGSVGAGTGACVGKLFGPARAMKGGIGSASLTVGAVTVGALVAVNAVGDVIDPTNGQVLAGARGDDDRPVHTARALCSGQAPAALLQGMSTTIGVLATDARLSKAQCSKLAGMAHNGLARTISPVHTPLDGDTLFALATGGAGVSGNLVVLGAMAAEVTARAVLNAVWAAQSVTLPGQPPLPAARDLHQG
jgi:L-aminopeptidase/D-esterase-like protein